MKLIKFNKVICVNNEIQGHGSKNLLSTDVDSRKSWLCQKGTPRGVVLLQLECSTVITAVRVGNAHSAFIEILVGRLGDATDKFQTLVPSSLFMDVYDSKSGTKPDRVKFFYQKDFCPDAANKEWQIIQVVCTQPFNDGVPFGVCFVRVTGLGGDVLAVESQKREDDVKVPLVPSAFLVQECAGPERTKRSPTISEEIRQVGKTAMGSVNDGSANRRSHRDSGQSERNDTAEAILNRRKRPREPAPEGSSRKQRKKGEGDEESGQGSSRRGTHTRRNRDGEEAEKEPAFSQLLSDVFFVISGFKNPARGDIRRRAVEMGATYSSDWDPRSTHLICSYPNTPKYNEVKGKGKIVKKDWIDSCYRDRKRYPWRRYALDPQEAGLAESEEEIGACSPGTSGDGKGPRRMEAAAEAGSTSGIRTRDDAYLTETDEEKSGTMDTSDYPMPHLPDTFAGKTFYVDRNVAACAEVERYIVAYSGNLSDTVNEGIEFYITHTGGALVKILRAKAPKLRAVKPDWIWEMNASSRWISPWPFLCP